MLTKKFLKQIESYIKKYFIKERKWIVKPVNSLGLVVSAVTVSNGRLYVDYCSCETSRKILEKWKQEKKNFPQHLLNFIAERGINEVGICKKVHTNRRVFSNLRNKKDYVPQKRTLIKIFFAMELNMEETQELLHKAGYSLSNISKKDTIIKFFFENRIYDLTLLNEVLNHYGFKPLC